MEFQLRAEIGKRLREVRKERGLTQKELASKIRGGVDYTYIGKIEGGKQFPSIGVLKMISDALAVPLSYFFLEEKTKCFLELLPEDLKEVTKNAKKQAFLRALKDINEEDVPLFIEIINVLNKHRKLPEKEEKYLKAAENRESYGENTGTQDER
ncbi:MAG: helix-turn-helix domain-containing protein [Syntrophales bacterium]